MSATHEPRPETAAPVAGRPPSVVVMGVSGVGKTTVARELARSLGVPFSEGDKFHSAASIAKMSAGIPLDDADRRSWLEAIGSWLHSRAEAGTGGVVSCSALRRRYRDTLRSACPTAFFVHLTGDPDTLEHRMGARTDHFMPKALLDSQLAALEPLETDEAGGTVDAAPSLAEVVDRALELVEDRRP